MPHGDAAVTLPLVDVRFAIRYDHNLLSLQMPGECQLEPLRRPRSALQFRFPLHHNSVHHVADVPKDRLKFRPFGRFAAGQTVDFLAPPPPGETRNQNGNRGGNQGENPEGDQHKSL